MEVRRRSEIRDQRSENREQQQLVLDRTTVIGVGSRRTWRGRGRPGPDGT